MFNLINKGNCPETKEIGHVTTSKQIYIYVYNLFKIVYLYLAYLCIYDRHLVNITLSKCVFLGQVGASLRGHYEYTYDSRAF